MDVQREASSVSGSPWPAAGAETGDAALRDAEQRYRAVFEASRDAMFIYTPDGTVVEANPAACRIYGFTRDQLVGVHAPDVIHPDALPHFREFQRVAAAGGDFRCETLDRRADGTVFPIEVSGTALTYNGRPHLMSVIRDITDRKRSEESRQMVELRFQRLVELSPLSTQIFWPDGRTRLVNRAWERLWGITLDHLRDYNILDDPQLTAAGAMPILRRAFSGESAGVIEPFPYVVPFGPAMGETRWAGAQVYPLRDADGRVEEVVLVHIDVTEQKRAEAAMARDAMLLAHVRDSVIVTDLAGVITFWNEGATRLFGWTADEMLGRPMAQRVPESDRAAVNQWIARIAEGGSEFEGEWLDCRKDGSRVWIYANTRRITDATGKPVAIMGVSHDISDRKAADAERERLLASEQAARAEAERQGRIKDEFLATLGHELRTPLNAILGWSQILKGSSATDPDDLAEGLRTIERNARAQTQIIEDLLDMSRIISGKVHLAVVRLADLRPVLDAAVATVRPAADAKGVRVDLATDPHAGPVSSDPGRLQQVFWNLLSNAVKFTPRGGAIRVRANRDPADTHLEVTVADTGEGIPPDFLPHVFERFRQADASTTRRHGGLGLGLSIVKQLVELHGGSVAAHTQGPGRGATFTVRLPLATAVESPAPPADTRPASPAPPTAHAAQGPIAGLKVLLVDDEADTRSVLQLVLEHRGAIVSTAASAQEALARLATDRPDVLISDIGMPDEDGYSLIRRVRARPGAGDLPAIALTAYARAEDRTQALTAGFHHHLAKPVEPIELIAILATLTHPRA